MVKKGLLYMKTCSIFLKSIKFILFLNTLFLPLFPTELKLELIDNGQGKSNDTTIYTGIPFSIKVSVINGTRDTGSVELLGLDKMHVLENSRSTNVSIINGQMSYQNSHIYQIKTDHEGDFKLGPARVKQNDQTLESNSLTLHATKPTAEMQNQNEEEEEKSASQKHEIICRLTTDKKTVVIGEPITAKITILSRGPILQIAMEPPKFSGFTVKEIKQFSRKQETIQDKKFNLLEKIYILTPQQHGEKEISPIKVIYTTPVASRRTNNFPFNDAFFSNFFEREHIEQKEITSNPVKILVDPLPENKMPIDGVGSFATFKAKLDKKEAVINEAVTLSLELSGKGNFDQITTPKLNLPVFIKYYESKVTLDEDLSTEYKDAKKHFDYVIQIEQEGTVEIPEQTFHYYDITTKTHKTLSTLPLFIKINPAPEQTIRPNTSTTTPKENLQEETPKKEIKIQSKQDIHFIQEDGVASQKTTQPLSFLIFIFLILLVPGFFYYKFFTNFIAQRLGFYGKLSKKEQHKQLLKLHKEFNNLAKTNQPGKLYQFFLNFLAIRFGITPEAVTHDILQENLSCIQWDSEKIATFLDYLNECASIQYTNQEKTPIKKNHALLFEKGSYWILLLTN